MFLLDRCVVAKHVSMIGCRCPWKYASQNEVSMFEGLGLEGWRFFNPDPLFFAVPFGEEFACAGERTNA
jgi:hypothetical protein